MLIQNIDIYIQDWMLSQLITPQSEAVRIYLMSFLSNIGCIVPNDSMIVNDDMGWLARKL